MGVCGWESHWSFPPRLISKMNLTLFYMLGIVPLLFCIILQTPEGGLNLVVNPGGGNTWISKESIANTKVWTTPCVV